jgi:diacylglycerol kinase family enzyme
LFDAGQITADHLHLKGEQTTHYFINSLDVGFGAQAIVHMKTVPKFLKGLSAYLTAVLKTLIDYPVLHLRIQLDDQDPFEQASVMAAITNGRCFGSSFWVCPKARADDGLFDLMVAQDVNRIKILKMIPQFMKGTHVSDPALRMYQAKRVVLESSTPLVVEADGELPLNETQRLEINILPKKVRIMI